VAPYCSSETFPAKRRARRAYDNMTVTLGGMLFFLMLSVAAISLMVVTYFHLSSGWAVLGPSRPGVSAHVDMS
jgi:hypothetical protein